MTSMPVLPDGWTLVALASVGSTNDEAIRLADAGAPEGTVVTFYGSSFIADQTGQLVAKATRDGEEVLTARFDLDAIAALRRSWGLFRDRRPDTYRALGTLDGIL